jgi:hypothetical protein
MPDKSILDMAPAVEIQMQINLGGLDTVMAQMVLNVRDGMAAVEHIYCTAATKAMDRLDVIQAFGKCYCLYEVEISCETVGQVDYATASKVRYYRFEFFENVV